LRSHITAKVGIAELGLRRQRQEQKDAEAARGREAILRQMQQAQKKAQDDLAAKDAHFAKESARQQQEARINIERTEKLFQDQLNEQRIREQRQEEEWKRRETDLHNRVAAAERAAASAGGRGHRICDVA
jgi:hypothetical protein